MKIELNNHEIKELSKAVTKFLKSRKFESNNHPNQFHYCTTFKQICAICGLAYTSSGCYAGFFICNITVFLDFEKKYKIYGFGMDEKGNCFADIHNIKNGTDAFYMYI